MLANTTSPLIGNLTATNTFNQIPGAVEPVNYYEFSVFDTSRISLVLSGITQNSAQASIIYDRNSNRLLDRENGFTVRLLSSILMGRLMLPWVLVII